MYLYYAYFDTKLFLMNETNSLSLLSSRYRIFVFVIKIPKLAELNSLPV